MFENQIQQGLFQGNKEKTFIDKILAKEDSDRLRELVKKPKLKREELLELLYLLGATESKLLNYSQWDRYVALKFFVWIREFVKVAELLYDYSDDLIRNEQTCLTCGSQIQKNGTCVCGTFKPKIKLNKRTRQLLYNNERLIEHNAKFLVDLYLNIGRTTLSLGATGFIEFLRTKFEFAYPQQQTLATHTPQAKTGILGLGKKGGGE